MQPDQTELLMRLMCERVLIIDGAFGTMVQQHHLNEEAFRGNHPLLCTHTHELKGDNDILVLSQPILVEDIHRAYLSAGADIIETNSFGATTIAQDDYGLGFLTRQMNQAAAAIARRVADEFSTPSHPRFVAGSIGPTNKTGSISPDVSNPAQRNITFLELVTAYREAVEGLAEGGADILLVETVFDTLNAKAALFAIESFFEASGQRLPVMISGTITDTSGRTLSGQTPEAFLNSIRPFNPIAVGLNCALGATLMRPYVAALSAAADCAILCYPNAGLPNPMSETGYDETPEEIAASLASFAQAGLVNIVGGCCGTTPDHIKAIAHAVRPVTPRAIPASQSA
ncbi:MAG: homocysteine S-methyltransferase family protein [Burkholderiales bacterium]|jgi:5-methyltetrahydrofolate--homocysteine methyltransferase|nr:homocysteine S-methyltransferase family protein [Burkholderiales bacterium]